MPSIKTERSPLISLFVFVWLLYYTTPVSFCKPIMTKNGKKNVCGDRVHEARCKHRLTQSDLAARLQLAGIIMERDSISRIEIGTRFVADYELRELAKILNVSVDWLLGEA